jgi:hypothetical protein
MMDKNHDLASGEWVTVVVTSLALTAAFIFSYSLFFDVAVTGFAVAAPSGFYVGYALYLDFVDKGYPEFD